MATKVESDRAAHIAEALTMLIPKLRRRLRERASIGDFAPSHVAVLVRLDREGPATASQLAAAEGMRPQSMSAIVTALLDDGLIEAKPDPSDGRQTLLSITSVCRKQIAAARAARADWLSQTIRAKLSAAEQRQLDACIQFLERLADE
jgi:DNA-binding MarR family transcriptional regulator